MRLALLVDIQLEHNRGVLGKGGGLVWGDQDVGGVKNTRADNAGTERPGDGWGRGVVVHRLAGNGRRGEERRDEQQACSEYLSHKNLQLVTSDRHQIIRKTTRLSIK